MPPTDSLLNDFPQHYKMSLKIYHFVCYTLHHWLEVFKSPQNILGLLSETQKCSFSHWRTSYCFAALGMGGSTLTTLLPVCLLVWAHLERPGERVLSVEGKCRD